MQGKAIISRKKITMLKDNSPGDLLLIEVHIQFLPKTIVSITENILFSFYLALKQTDLFVTYKHHLYSSRNNRRKNLVFFKMSSIDE
jgi:hypothetical protein